MINWTQFHNKQNITSVETKFLWMPRLQRPQFKPIIKSARLNNVYQDGFPLWTVDGIHTEMLMDIFPRERIVRQMWASRRIFRTVWFKFLWYHKHIINCTGVDPKMSNCDVRAPNIGIGISMSINYIISNTIIISISTGISINIGISISIPICMILDITISISNNISIGSQPNTSNLSW